MIRQGLQEQVNYWDYLINRLADRPDDLTALRQTTKTDIAWLFINQYV